MEKNRGAVMHDVEAIAGDPLVGAALAAFKADVKQIIDLAISIQQIPSPTFGEAKRSSYVKSQFEHMGLGEVSQDELFNVYGLLPGRGDGTPVIISAHLDTVFAEDMDLSIRFEGPGSKIRRVYGPGIADNSLGIAGLLTLGQYLRQYQLRTRSDIWLVANVCEEGLGDLKGMRAVVDRFGSQTTYIVVEGGSFGLVFHQAIGVNRFEIEVTTPGGHSWGDFGKPNAIHILSKVITKIQGLYVPQEPKTSFNIGVIEGGTTINAIASQAKCQLDLRSADKEILADLTERVRKTCQQADRQPNVKVMMRQIGARPSGAVPADSPLVRSAVQALETVGFSDPELLAGSTDASVPLGLGIPAVCIGLANSGNTHRVDEFVDIKSLHLGMGQLLLLALSAAGRSPQSSDDASF